VISLHKWVFKRVRACTCACACVWLGSSAFSTRSQHTVLLFLVQHNGELRLNFVHVLLDQYVFAGPYKHEMR